MNENAENTCATAASREAMEKGGYECETSVHSADGAGRLIDRATEMKALLQ